MNLLDIIIIVMMVFLVVKGLFRGFVREVASLGGIILGIWAASQFYPQLTGYVRSLLPNSFFLPLISFAAIFALVLLLCNVLGWGLKMLLKKAFLGWADKVLGTVLALAKGVIIMYLIIVLLTFFLPGKTPLIAQSRLAPLVISSYQSMVRLISPEHYQRLKKKLMGQKDDIGGILSGKPKEGAEKDGKR
ncbi:MAG: CvpA family protein [Pseudomonadota bacterium]